MAAPCSLSFSKKGFWGWVVFLFIVARLDAAPNDPPTGFPDLKLPKKVKGEEAVQALGNKIPEVASFYHIKADDLKKRLRSDKTLWVDTRGRLFYVCDWTIDPQKSAPAKNVVTPLGLVAPYENTFLLHSRPGASKIIYLDFDGHDASATSWGTDAIGRPFDLDGNPSSFSNTERDAIQNIWQYVVEDFSIYDVDVTTEDPGVEALRKLNSGDASYGIRVAIGGSSFDWYGSAGGVAYIGSFDWNSDTPCWVFPKQLADNAKYIAEAVSHETGHTLGLNHDGQDVGTTHTEYYAGQGNWAPIMGVGYYEPITQWSRGEYTNANNLQDDLTVMLGEGISYRTDDHGNNIATATPMIGVSFTNTGVIERTNDVDFFLFQTGSGKISLTATPAALGPNLHIYLSLFDSLGNLITTTNSTDTTSGVQPVTLTSNVPTGTYFVSVDGIGSGNPVNTGYSDYGSLGQYTIIGNLPTGSGWLPAAGGGYLWSATGNWASNMVPNAAEAIARCTNNILGDQTISLDISVTIGRLILGDADESHSFTIENGPGGSLNFQSTSGNAFLVKTSGLNDTIATPVLLNSSLIITNTAASDLIVGGSISGTNSISKRGSGRVLLAGTNSYSGATVVAGGTLDLSTTGSIGNSPRMDVQAGAVFSVASLGGSFTFNNQTLSGAGSLAGDISTAGNSQIFPGTNGVAGTLTFSNNLTLNNGTKLSLDLAVSQGIGGGTNDLIVVNGNLNLSGTIPVDLNFLASGPASPGTYTIIQYAGTFSGSAANFVCLNSNRYSFVFDDSVPGQIRVQVTGVPTSLVWKGDGIANAWTVATSTNWLNSGNPATFLQLDTVTFDDTGSNSPAITLSGILNPTSVTVSSSTNYSFAGSGKISGAASLTKADSGTLTINTPNDYAGSTLINGGILKIGNSSALGLSSGNTTVANGATLDINAFGLGAEPITISGAGISNNGVVINGSTTTQSNAFRFVTLSGDTTLGGNGRWDIRANPTGSLTGNNSILTKTGSNEIWLSNLGSSGLADINVNQGALIFHGSTTMGDSTKNVTVASNAVLALASTDINVLNKKLIMNGGATVRNDSGDNLFSGIATLAGSNSFNIAFNLEMQGVIGGSGSLLKTGAGTLSLSANNTYAGTITVSNGTLRARNAGALGSTNSGTVIASGARLDVNSQNLGAEPITVAGSGLGTGGAIVNNGNSAQNNALRFVTLTTNVTFGGASRWDIRANPTANLVGNNFSLTKVGGNEIWLANLGPSGLGNITISEGILGIETNTTLGNAANTLAINSPGSLGISSTGTNVLGKVLSMSSGRIYNAGGSNFLVGATTLSGSNVFDIASGTGLTMSGNIGGSGSLNKFTAGTLVFTGTNTFSGLSYLNTGTIQIGNGGGSGSFGTGAISNNASLVFYRSNDFTVANAISGSGSVTKTGPGILTLSASNAFGGVVTVNTGTLKVGNVSALGTTNAGTIISNGATLDLNGLSLGQETLASVEGVGVGANGAVINTGAAQTNAVRWITLAGNTTFGGSGRWDIRAPIGSTNGLIGQGFTLSKIGNNQIWLANLGNTDLGDITINSGSLGIEGVTSLGNPAKTVNVAGTSLALSDTGTNLNKLWSFSTASITNLSGANTLKGNAVISGVNTFNIASGSSLAMAGAVSSIGSITKSGAGTLYLQNAGNSYNGPTVISAGTLTPSSTAAVASSISIQVDAGAVLDVANVGNLSINNGRTLLGNGTVVGNTTINGTLSPGLSIGRLTFQNSLTLAGTTSMELFHSGVTLTNDRISVTGTLALGGNLVVTNTGSSLQSGDTFQLFNAGTFSGGFASVVLPSLSSGLVWNTNNLSVNGSIAVGPVAAPTISALVVPGPGLTFSLQSQAGVTYILQTTPNLNPPILWTPIATNIGDGGLLSIPVAIQSDESERLFRLQAY